MVLLRDYNVECRTLTCKGVLQYCCIGTEICWKGPRYFSLSWFNSCSSIGKVLSVYQCSLNLIWFPVCVLLSILHRLVYWVSLNACSSWRGFGSGLTVFPLLAMVALNLFLMYTLNLKEPLFGSQDVLYNQVTPSSSWSGETSQSPSGTPDILPTDILDAQWGGELRFLLSEEEIFPKIGHSCGLQFSTATHAATITSKSVTA